MAEMTVTDFSRNLRITLDRLEFGNEEIILKRNNHLIARIIPGPQQMNALEAMSDIYSTITEEAAISWVADGKMSDTIDKIKGDKWDS